jgi:hypothetical protein
MVAYIDVKVRTDASDVRRDLDRAAGATSSAGSRIKDSLKAIGGAMAAAFAADKIKDFVMESITAASDLNETVNKTKQVFGDSGDAILQWSKDSSNAVGMSQTAALDAAATFAVFGKSAGLTGKDLVGFSENLVSTSADFASFANTTPQDAIESIGAALRGEYEPIRKYGLIINESSVKQEALRQGLIKTTKDALEPAKRALVVNGLVQAFSKAQGIAGDFQRTSDGLANKQRIFAAQVENAKAALGQALLPVMLLAINSLMNLGRWLVTIAKFIQQNAVAFGILAVGIAAATIVIQANAIATKALILWQKAAAIATRVWAAAQALLNGVMSANTIGLLIIAIAALVAGVIYAYKHFAWFRNIVQGVMRAVTAAAQGFARGATAAFRAVANFASQVAGRIMGIIRGLLNFLLRSPVGAAILGPWRIAIGALRAFVNGGVHGVMAYFSGLISALRRILSPVANILSAPFRAAWNSIMGVWRGAVGFFQGIVNSIRRVFDIGMSGIRSVWNAIAHTINAVHISLKVPSFIPGIGGKGWEWSTSIPYLAKGGYVTSPTLAMIGEAGAEYVIPESKLAALGGTTINVYGALDADNVARQIQRLLRGRNQRAGGVTRIGREITA